MSTAPYKVPFRYRARRYFHLAAPILFWGVAVALTGYLWLNRSFTPDIQGLAREMRYRVSPMTPGRVSELEVSLHERVNKGQLLVVLDDEHVRTMLETARAELAKLRGELTRERGLQLSRIVGAEGDHVREIRRFARDIEQIELESLDLATQIAEDQARLHGVELRLERSRGLADQDLGSAARVEDDEALRETLRAKLAATREQKAAIDKRQLEARERYEAWCKSSDVVDEKVSVDALIRPFEEAVRVQELRLEELRLAMRRLVLRAPATGLVANVLAKVGETVDPGSPILEIVEESVREVVAWLPEERIGQVMPGTRVEMRSRRSSALQVKSLVRAVGASIEVVPERLQPVGVMAPLWGQAVYMELPGNVHALPGEAFDVRFLGREDAPGGMATPKASK